MLRSFRNPDSGTRLKTWAKTPDRLELSTEVAELIVIGLIRLFR